MGKNVPSLLQLELARAMAQQTRKRLPRGYTVRLETCVSFIEENKAYIRPSDAQLSFALRLSQLYCLDLKREDFLSYIFCKKFLDLFTGTKNDAYQGIRRMNIIESYMREDKEFEHLQFKLELSAEDVAFMKEIIVTHRNKGSISRWDDASAEEQFPDLKQQTVMVSEEVPVAERASIEALEELHAMSEEERTALLVSAEKTASVM